MLWLAMKLMVILSPGFTDRTFKNRVITISIIHVIYKQVGSVAEKEHYIS